MRGIIFVLCLTILCLFFLSGCGGGGSSSSSGGKATVSGTVTYEDKIYGSTGFTTTVTKAVRYGRVEIVDSSSSQVLALGDTGADGSYSITFTYKGNSVYPRIIAEATMPGALPIAVKNLSGVLYAKAGNNITLANNGTYTSQDIFIPASSIGGAFNILDVFTNGFQFVYSQAGAYPPVSLFAYWQVDNMNGTYYCPANGGCIFGEGIYVYNNPSADTDEYDDDVLYHEFGHFTAAHFSQDDSPGGVHTLNNNDLDMRLAWSEGWGDSMPGNIKLWLNSTNPNLLSSSSGVPLTEYVDTIPSGVGIAIDMDKPGNSPYVYACGEVAVAKILLDLNMNVGMANVWSVINNFKTNPPTTSVNLELFWDRWTSVEPVGTLPALQTAFNDRLIRYSDIYSNNTVSASALISLSSPTTYNLYPATDADYFSFNTTAGQPYTITTSGLINGADTFLTLYNPDSTINTTNDNASGIIYISGSNYDFYDTNGNYIYPRNTTSNLASRITFTAVSSGNYYLSVQSSASRPKSAGRYGTYTLTITSP